MNPVIKTRHGEVRGTVADRVNTFKGVPYAAPPFGANRVRPLQPVEPLSGVRDSFTFGHEAPQLRPLDPQIQALAPDPAVPGEDCLNLNIWSPDVGSAGLPVMVWIPGGMKRQPRLARPSRRPRVGAGEHRGHLHVRVRLALTGVQWALRRVSCAGDCLRFRHARQGVPADGGAASRSQPSATAR